MIETRIKRTEITIETHSRTVIKTRGDAIETTFCKTCGRIVPILTTAETASIFGARMDFVEALGNSNQIHAVAENAVCAVSVADYFNKTTALPGVKHEGEEEC
jgi:hypothetical protein